MEIKQIETKNLVDDERFRNKFENEYILNKLRTAIQRHGQTALVHVIHKEFDDYGIVSGSNTVKILKELGVEKTFCFVHTNYQEAVLVMLELDSLRFETDYFKIAEKVKQLNQLGITNQRIQHSVSWTKEELDNMLKMEQFDWEKFGEPDEAANQISLF